MMVNSVVKLVEWLADYSQTFLAKAINYLISKCSHTFYYTRISFCKQMSEKINIGRYQHREKLTVQIRHCRWKKVTWNMGYFVTETHWDGHG